MSQNRLPEALDDCIDRLGRGQLLDDCLRLYPNLAKELEQLLVPGLVISRARASSAEVVAMRRRLDAQFQVQLQNFRIWRNINLIGGFILFIMLGGGMLLFNLIVSGESIAPSPTPTRVVTATYTATAPTATATITQTPTYTLTPTFTLTITPSFTASPSPTISPSATPAACVVAPPAGWVEYRVRPGDTLSGVAAQTGTTVSQLMTVNCIEQASFIVVNQLLFIPQPIVVVPPPATSGEGGNQSGMGSNNDDGDDDDDDDDDD